MRHKSFAILLVMLLIMFMTAGVYAGTTTVGIQSTIDQEGMNAKQHLGTFEVPSGGSAYGFSGSASIVDAKGFASGVGFSIERYDVAKNIVVFRRDFKGVDSPTLSSLQLGPGKYVLVIGGYPGSRAQISFTLSH